jgi:hypothetical protein
LVARAFLFVAACLAVCSTAWAEVRVTGSLDPPAVTLGEPAILTITIEGSGSFEGEPDFHAPDGIRVRSGGESRNFSLVNGRFSQTLQRQYAILALRGGAYSIGPVTVKVSGRSYSLGPYDLTAGPAATPPPAGNPPDRGDAGDSEDRGPTPPIAVEMRVEPAEVYVGQQAILSVRFLTRADVAVLDARFIAPESEGFWKVDLPQVPQSVVRRGGASYRVSEVRMALFPTRVGELKIDPARVHVQYRDSRRDPNDPFSFFGMGGREREAEPASNPCTVRARPLPKPEPGGFGGAVGRFSMSARFDRDTGAQGQPITWTVTIEGDGNVSSIEGPRFPDLPGCRGIDGGSDVKSRQDVQRVGGSKSFSRVLIPEAAGSLEIPSLAWAYFDPEDGRYHTLTIPARRIAIAAATVAQDAGGGRIGGALRPIRDSSRLAPLAGERPWRQPGFWILQLVPMGALALGIFARRRRLMIERDPTGARIRHAPRQLTRALRAVETDQQDPWGALVRAVEEFLDGRYGSEIRGLTRGALVAYLVESGANPEAAQSMAALLGRADTLRFTPRSDSTRDDLSGAVRLAAECAARMGERRNA